MMMKPSALALLALVCAASLVATHGHGYLTVPAARQLVTQKPGVYLQHGNSLGTGPGRRITNPGVCGDPFQESNSNVASYAFNSNTPYVYSSGGTIDITLTLTANHGGRHHFRVCPSNMPSEACFGTNYLTAVSGDGIAPGKRYWYSIYNAARFAKQPWEVYTSKWRLPAGVSCQNGCILQWSWAAYQNCALPCESATVDDMSKCGLDQRGNKNLCNDGPTLFAEVFNNCADIKITGSGSGGPTTPTNPSNPTNPTTPETPTTPTTPSTPKTPENPTMPVDPPKSGSCVDTFEACSAWKKESCNMPGVSTFCPCMCGAKSG